MSQNKFAFETCWQAWFDGSAAPNPGKIGIGAVLLSPDGQRFEMSRLANHVGCNNEGELLALCAILELALEHKATHIVVTGDSDVVVRYVTGIASTEVARFASLITHAQKLMARFAYAELKWMPRHRNVDADRLSRLALGLSVIEAPPKPRRRNRR